jgi:molybdopterin-containing oxidoreductase family iron-sulfur binding subunit
VIEPVEAGIHSARTINPTGGAHNRQEVPMAVDGKAVVSNNGKTPRWGMAIDLKRCVGCQSCTLACKAENGTPREVFWMRVLEKEEGTYPQARKVFLPVRCNHCAEPPCVPVCPTGASYKRSRDNLVLINQDKCIGCRACIVACPYQVRFIPEDTKGYYGEELTPYEAKRYQRWQPRTVQKCTFCEHRLEVGDQPACVQTCPTRALIFGDLNDPESEISKLVRSRNHFQPRAELGTDPSVYYLT